MRGAGHVARMGDARNAYILVGKPEWKRRLGGSRCRWEDDNRTDLREIRGEGVDWIHLVQDRDQWQALVNIMKLRVPL